MIVPFWFCIAHKSTASKAQILVLRIFHTHFCFHLRILHRPGTTDNAEISAPYIQYVVGTNITFTCDEYYTGGGISTCQCNGEWSSVPECSSKYEVKTKQ